ncbi:MAG TPA: FecR domain-containing protein [Noviherbaspirillum sp.]|nr:FecR domain-containing protein [Noviherbaspirillum sp.]
MIQPDFSKRSTFQHRPTAGVIATVLCLAAAPVLAKNELSLGAKIDDRLVHTVQKNETLSDIAARFTGRVSNWRTIGRLNRIDNDRTIPVGTPVLIPVRLLPAKPATASIVSLVGDVQIQRKSDQSFKATAGGFIMEGDRLTTQRNSLASISLDDGTRITIRPDTSAVVRRLRITPHINKSTAQFFLERGRIESHVPVVPGKGRPDYEVVSPMAVSSVRGTAFRVGYDERRYFNETLSGTVAVGTGKGKGNAQRLVGKGFGTVVESGRINAPVSLLDAAALQDGYQSQDKLPVEFSLMHKDAAAFHVHISKDVTGAEIMQAAQAVAAKGAATARLGELPDGRYFVHYSAVSASGLEGMPGVASFQLNARPFPPLVLHRESRFQGNHPGEDVAVTMEWSLQDGISGYRLQIANDAGFQSPFFDRSIEGQTGRYAGKLPPGTYYWRVASISLSEGAPDQGPFGDAQLLQVLDGQAAPAIEQTDSEMRFRWRGGAGQKYVFQVSADPEFGTPTIDLTVESPMASLSGLAPGTYFARTRSLYSDGFIGAFSPPQKFVVPLHWRSVDGSTWRTEAGPIGPEFDR